MSRQFLQTRGREVARGPESRVRGPRAELTGARPKSPELQSNNRPLQPNSSNNHLHRPQIRPIPPQQQQQQYTNDSYQTAPNPRLYQPHSRDSHQASNKRRRPDETLHHNHHDHQQPTPQTATEGTNVSCCYFTALEHMGKNNVIFDQTETIFQFSNFQPKLGSYFFCELSCDMVHGVPKVLLHVNNHSAGWVDLGGDRHRVCGLLGAGHNITGVVTWEKELINANNVSTWEGVVEWEAYGCNVWARMRAGLGK